MYDLEYFTNRKGGVSEMAMPNAFVAESGDLIQRVDVRRWLRMRQEEFYLAVCIGGGKQINEEFEKRGWETKFCPMGRMIETLKQREACEKVLRENQAITQDLFVKEGIIARVIIPFDIVADVLNPFNNDTMVFHVYLSYDKIFRLTTMEKVEKKCVMFANVARAFAPIAGENGVDMALSKIEVVGF
jgi:hypothetical protein